MSNISFLTSQKEQAVVNNVETLKTAILSAYDPVSFTEKSNIIRISPVINVLYGIRIESTGNFSRASFSFEIGLFEEADFYGLANDKLQAIYAQERAGDKKAFLALQKIARRRYGKNLDISLYSGKSRVKVDVTELDIETLACVEKLLRVSRLKPRANDIRHVNFR